MELAITIFLLLLSLGFLVTGYIVRFDKRSNYSFISGFTLIMLTGLLLLNNPITFQTGSTTFQENNYLNETTLSNSTITLTDDYTPIPLTHNWLIAITLILGGLWGIVTSILKIMKWKITEEE